MLIVNRRVTSAVPSTPSPRSFHASCSWSTRSRGRRDPTRGGIVVSNGPSTSARLPSHASQRSYASASAFENCAICVAAARGVVVGELQRATVAVRHEVAVLRVHLVAVLRELELRDDRRRHEADDVRQRGDVELGAPRLFGRRRAADLRSAFEHRDARAAPREQPGGDEPVVPAADDDDVEPVGAHRATRSSSGRQVSSAGGCASGSLARSSARRSARIASRSGSAASAAIAGGVERVALQVQRLDAARAEPGAVRGIGRDEIALGLDVRADEPGDPRAEQRLDERRAAARVVAVVVRDTRCRRCRARARRRPARGRRGATACRLAPHCSAWDRPSTSGSSYTPAPRAEQREQLVDGRGRASSRPLCRRPSRRRSCASISAMRRWRCRRLGRRRPGARRPAATATRSVRIRSARASRSTARPS